MEKGLAEHPDHVVFNGKVGALMGDNVLKAKAGDTVRIYFGNIGPNGTWSFHVIGEIFDRVNVEGSLDGTVNKNVQTTLVPSAGAVIVEFKIDVPGGLPAGGPQHFPCGQRRDRHYLRYGERKSFRV